MKAVKIASGVIGFVTGLAAGRKHDYVSFSPAGCPSHRMDLRDSFESNTANGLAGLSGGCEDLKYLSGVVSVTLVYPHITKG